jgi:hypothetical protein
MENKRALLRALVLSLPLSLPLSVMSCGAPPLESEQTASTPPANATLGAFTPVLVDGGGTITMPAFLPPTAQFPNGQLVLGGDVEGYFRSTDHGDHWAVTGTGVYQGGWRDVAAIHWSTLESNTVYACVGENGNGGFLVSSDGGQSWSMRSTAIQFHGNHPSPPLASEPRMTGNLLAQDPAGYLYAATYDQGVFRSVDKGKTWQPIGFTGSATTKFYGKSLALDPAHPDTLYASMFKDGLYKTTDARSTTQPTWTKLTNAPSETEEVILVGGVLYAAAGSAGILRSTDGGTSWTSLNGSFVDTTQSYWKTLAGAVEGQSHVIVADCDNPVRRAGDTAYRSLIKLIVGAATGTVAYQDLTNNASKLNTDTIPPDGRSWWHEGAHYENWLGGAAWQDGFVVIDASNPQNLYVAGPGGFYRSSDGGGTWLHAINGLPIFVGRDLALDPNNAKHVVFTTSDWTSFDLSDGIGYDASTTKQLAPVQGTEGYGITFDPGDSTVYLGTGAKYTNNGGQLYSRPSTSSTWTDTGFAAAVGTGDIALALTAGRDASKAPFLVAAVASNGLWRYQPNKATNKWTRVDTTIAADYHGPAGFSFARQAGTPYVYAFDRFSGVFRSSDYGQSWSPLWSGARASDERTGFIALNPAKANELWISTDAGLYMIANAAAGGTPSLVSGVAHPGGIAVSSSGVVYAVTLPDAAQPDTGLVKSSDRGLTWNPAANSSLAACASRPGVMHIATDGQLYINNDANVTCHGYPL